MLSRSIAGSSVLLCAALFTQMRLLHHFVVPAVLALYLPYSLVVEAQGGVSERELELRFLRGTGLTRFPDMSKANISKPALDKEIREIKRRVAASQRGRRVPEESSCDQNGCCRKPLRVHFKNDLGWESVLYPAYFEAFTCSGRCRGIDEGGAVFGTQHALFQSVLAGQNRSVPRPCCLSTKTTDLEVLISGEKEIFRTFKKDMVILECGCQ